MKKILLLLPILALTACGTTRPPLPDKPDYRKPSSGAKKLLMKNDSRIKNKSDLDDLAKKLSGSTVKYSNGVYTWDLKGGVLDGKNQKGDGGQSEGQEPLFRAEIPLILKNGFVQNNKDAALFYKKDSGVDKVTFTNIGEDAIATRDGVDDFFVKNSQFINDENGDKSIQLNGAKNAKIENNLIYGGVTGVRVHESSSTSSSDKAYAKGNKFMGVDTAWHVSKGGLVIEGKNSYQNVRLPFKSSNGAKIENADGKVENN